MSAIVSREIHLTARPDGMPVPENFKLVEQTLSPGDSDIVVQNLYMSVDPYMRGRMYDRKVYVRTFQVDPVMEGFIGMMLGENIGKMLVNLCSHLYGIEVV